MSINGYKESKLSVGVIQSIIKQPNIKIVNPIPKPKRKDNEKQNFSRVLNKC